MNKCPLIATYGLYTLEKLKVESGPQNACCPEHFFSSQDFGSYNYNIRCDSETSSQEVLKGRQEASP